MALNCSCRDLNPRGGKIWLFEYKKPILIINQKTDTFGIEGGCVLGIWVVWHVVIAFAADWLVQRDERRAGSANRSSPAQIADADRVLNHDWVLPGFPSPDPVKHSWSGS